MNGRARARALIVTLLPALTDADAETFYGRPWEELTLTQRALSDEFMKSRPPCRCEGKDQG